MFVSCVAVNISRYILKNKIGMQIVYSGYDPTVDTGSALGITSCL